MPKSQQHVDLIALIEKHAGIRLQRKARTDSGEYVGQCPWCPGSKDSFLVWPHSERPHYNHVRGCGRNGDALFFLQDYCGMSFPEACEELGIDVEDALQERIERKGHDTHNPPCKIWQERAREFLHVCQKVLWSEKGKEALAWLRDRGLTNEIIKQAQLGYCPVFYRDELEHWGLKAEDVNRDEVRIPEGIVIPWFYGPDLWKLAVRRLRPEENQPKYGQVVGSSEGLYNADDVKPDRPVMLVEGEFDALAVLQQMQSYDKYKFKDKATLAVVATGSTTRGYTHRWVSLMNEASIILQSFDDDPDGDKAAERWLHTFPQAMRWLPLAHDPNEMLLAPFCNIHEWVLEGLSIAKKPVERLEPVEDISITCSICGKEVEYYDNDGTAFCGGHYPPNAPLARPPETEDDEPDFDDDEPFPASPAPVEPAQETPIDGPLFGDTLTCFAWSVARIAEVFPGPCKLIKHESGYTLSDYVVDLKRMKEAEEKPDFWQVLRAKLSVSGYNEQFARDNSREYLEKAHKDFPGGYEGYCKLYRCAIAK